MAADIANRICDLVDTVYKKIQADRTREALHIVEREFEAAKQYVRQIEDSLDRIRQKGINNYRAEAEVYNAAYAEALATGNRNGLQALQQKIETLSKYGGPSLSLMGELELEQKRVALLRDKLLAANVNATQTIPRKYVVNKASASEKKSHPVTWLIVLMSGISIFLITSFTVILLDKVRTN
jgi:Cu2+-containing amine oxidase